MIESLKGLEREIDDLEAQLDESERIAAAIPHRARYLALSHRLPRKLLDAHREWVREVATELASADSSSPPPGGLAGADDR